MVFDGGTTDLFDGLLEVALPVSSTLGVTVECLLEEAHGLRELSMPVLRPQNTRNGDPSFMLSL